MQNDKVVLELGSTATDARAGRALWATGFRPFFLLAGFWAVTGVPLWLILLRGGAAPGALRGVVWHGHEMLFGFVTAVIAGFLLTAVRNWTGGRATASGAGLAALAGLWVAGRVVMLPGVQLHPGVAAIVCFAFLPALGLVVARPIIAARNVRNYPVLLVLAALSALHAATLYGALNDGAPPTLTPLALRGALLVVVTLCLIIGGRIIPLFTRNTTGVRKIRSLPIADAVAIGGTATLAVLTVAGANAAIVATASTVAGVAAIARMWHWGTQHTARHPLLWILHLGHAWIALALLLPIIGLAGVPRIGLAQTHAFAVGGVGTLILGMMARVAIGHTGRPLVAPTLTAVAFVVFTVGATLRAIAPVIWPDRLIGLLDAAGTCWVVAFALYLAAHGPMLCSSRPDGRPG